MRITAKAKQETRRQILAAAKRLFRAKGFDQATTRDIAGAAGIAAGTLFNYFPGKEAIVLALVSEAVEKAGREFARERRPEASLEEDLFAHIAAELRQLKPIRKFVRPVIDVSFSPAAMTPGDRTAEAIRAGHLETVERLLHEHGAAEALSAVTLQLYWTLYIGVLTFWCEDRSPHQEDALALIDQSLKMFVTWLHNQDEVEN